ncbi:hypothetical protein [Bacillus sp. FJAT-22090]|uniref:hypothetical protein n=1 Tax=Bacillus sp. FJAT-22090 TaxID=1581038 RepID=UPI0011A59980|nr:hypothetical protein [Bacillus sp. FJAT-22090]
MNVKLECVDTVKIKTSLYEEDYSEINIGEVVEAHFSQFGVKFLVNNGWTLHFEYGVANKWFKVYGQ